MRTLSLDGPRGPVVLGEEHKPFFILGPCVIESRSLVREVAAELEAIRERLGGFHFVQVFL